MDVTRGLTPRNPTENGPAHSNARDGTRFVSLSPCTADALLRPHLLPSSITAAKANRASSSSWTEAVRRASSSAEACRSPTAVKCASIAADAACTSRAASATLTKCRCLARIRILSFHVCSVDCIAARPHSLRPHSKCSRSTSPILRMVTLMFAILDSRRNRRACHR